MARLIVVCIAMLTFVVGASGQPAAARVAVLDFGPEASGTRAAVRVRELFLNVSTAKEFALIDSDLANAAARGVGYQSSLNLTTAEARDLGAAIGADFYFIGDAETVRRSPSTGSAYYESFASVFLVSGRTGRLISWERPLERGETPDQSEKALLQILASDETRHRYQIAMRRAFEAERVERAAAVEPTSAIIEMMRDGDDNPNSEVRPPRPYRRIKPAYPEAAALAEIEAVVDVLVDIDARGEISRIEVARWAGYGLDQSVVDTVKQMHFFPAMRNRVAIPMRILLRYNFRRPPRPAN